MLYTELTKKAMAFAYKAHEGQVDKGGVPYIFHPFHVAEQMHTEAEVCVALLHDVIEDTDYTEEDIRKLGFDAEIVDAIVAITKLPGEDYMDYIRRLKQNALARAVKEADIVHNSDVTRLPGDDKYNDRLLKKYAAAKKILES